MARSQRLKSPRYSMWFKKSSEEEETLLEEIKRRRESGLIAGLALAPQSPDLDQGPENIKSQRSTGEDITHRRAAALQDLGQETRTETETGEERRKKSTLEKSKESLRLMSQTTLEETLPILLTGPKKEKEAPIRRATATCQQLTIETLRGVLTIKEQSKSSSTTTLLLRKVKSTIHTQTSDHKDNKDNKDNKVNLYLYTCA